MYKRHESSSGQTLGCVSYMYKTIQESATTYLKFIGDTELGQKIFHLERDFKLKTRMLFPRILLVEI